MASPQNNSEFVSLTDFIEQCDWKSSDLDIVATFAREESDSGRVPGDVISIPQKDLTDLTS